MPRLLLLILLPFLASACTESIAHDLIAAPNRHDPRRGTDAPQKLLDQLYIFRQLRYSVAPPATTALDGPNRPLTSPPIPNLPTQPDASLSVWIIEPFHYDGVFLVDYPTPDTFTLRPETPADFHPNPQPPLTPKATLIFLTGIGEQKEDAPAVIYGLGFAAKGYRSILVDLRGNGRSTGDTITYGPLECRDLSQLLDQLDRDHLLAGNLGVVGGSYGAAFAIQWAAVEPRVRAVVAMEPFSSDRQAAQDTIPQMLGPWHWFLSKKDIDHIVTLAGTYAGFDPDHPTPLSAIAHSTTPILLIHGTHDHFLPPEHHSIPLHDAAPDHTQLLLLDAQHRDLWLRYKTIRPAALDWFERYLTTPPPNP